MSASSSPETRVARPTVAAARRIVIKLGTRALTHDDGRLALGRLDSVIDRVASLRRSGREVLLVSSGAIGLGRSALGLESTPRRLALRQACAAVGQSRLMSLWEEGLSRAGQLGAQVLLTSGDFDDRRRYLNLRRTLGTLLEHGVVPVINENDAVSSEELRLAHGSGAVFGDNDRLSALVASKLDADLLVMLTDVEGVMDGPPDDPSSRVLSRIESPDAVTTAGAPGSELGRGGMASKVDSAFLAVRAGCEVVVASGRAPGALEALLAGGDVGSWFPANSTGLPARRRWIAFAAASRGSLAIDDGAVTALTTGGASLLAAGVTQVDGAFVAGDVVELLDPCGDRIGRGIVRCDAETAKLWCHEAASTTPSKAQPLIRRTHLVLEVTP